MTANVLVIGAGPAGVSAAMRLQACGVSVTLVDRSEFPRDKVCGCCLNLSALASLSRIQCDSLVADLVPKNLRYWSLQHGSRRIAAELPGGIALSRRAMDAALVAQAAARGVDFRSACDAKIISVDDKSVCVELRTRNLRCNQVLCDVVVLATGLSGGGVSQWLPWEQSPTGPIGVGTNLTECAEVKPQTIHMLSGDDGYVGLVQLEDQSIDLAAAVRRPRGDNDSLNRQSIANRINAILAAASWSLRVSEQSLRMTPPLTRRRRVGYGRLIAIGDAARYVEPFTGEGMAWAIESGIEAADCIVNFGVDEIAAHWTRQSRLLQRQRQWVCRAMSFALSSPAVSRMLGPAMQIAPWAVKRTIHRINSR